MIKFTIDFEYTSGPDNDEENFFTHEVERETIEEAESEAIGIIGDFARVYKQKEAEANNLINENE